MKRKLNENNTKSKKRRKSNTEQKITSKLFSDETDQKQFQMLYKLLSNCKFINFIPSYVIYTISEFATGKFEKCDNYEQCHNEIAILNQHKLQSNEERDFSIFKHEWIRDKFQLFCNECTKYVEQCTYVHWGDDYQCFTMIVHNNPSKCSCGRQIIFCSEHLCECPDCKVLMCTQKDVWREEQCWYHLPEICAQCDQDISSYEPKRICCQKTQVCECCKERICNNCIDRCFCDDRWCHKGCVGTLDKPENTDCSRCICCVQNLICLTCDYNEPKTYKCNNCVDEDKYQTLCCDCQSDNEIHNGIVICFLCATELEDVSEMYD
eukprot:274147_1